MESSVDLPHPDGPSIATYSPRSIVRLIVAQRAGLDLLGEIAAA